MKSKYISWFSCGAASAVATKLALKEFGAENVRVVYQDTGSEHPDNARFFSDCQEWFGVDIERQKSEKYVDIWDVFEKTKYLAGVGGARCTYELKKKLAEETINYGPGQQLEIFGYTYEEKKRAERFIEHNNERKVVPILIERGLTKDDCLGMLLKAGIKIPAMYELGYRNNNCIGCPKGQSGYWNKIRKDFKETFDRMSGVEERLDVAINKKYQLITTDKAKEELGNQYFELENEGDSTTMKKESFKLRADGKISVRRRVFLKDLPEDAGKYEDEPSIQCGLMCQIESDGL